MDDADKLLLLNNHVELAKEICMVFHDVANFLFARRVITFEILQEIMSKKTPLRKAYALLITLPTRGKNAFNIFHKCTCYYGLWGAADILKPEYIPNERNYNGLSDQESHLYLPHKYSSFHYNSPWARTSDHGTYAEPRPQHALATASLGHAFQTNRIPANRSFSENFSRHVQMLPPPEIDDRLQVTNPANSILDSTNGTLTEGKCQDLIKEYRVPLNLFDYFKLVYCEEKAKLQDRRILTFVESMMVKLRKHFQLIEQKESHLKPTKQAEKMVTSISELQSSHGNFRFFMVWALSKPFIEGPAILGFSSKYIEILDYVTKEPKRGLQWSLEDLKDVTICEDYYYSLIMDFRQHTIILLSPEFEEIYQALTDS